MLHNTHVLHCFIPHAVNIQILRRCKSVGPREISRRITSTNENIVETEAQ